MGQASLKRRFFRSPLQSCGHGKVNSRKISKGAQFVKIGGVRKEITPGNIKGGKIYWYNRSDTKKPALRNFARDRGMRATRHSMSKRGYSGD